MRRTLLALCLALALPACGSTVQQTDALGSATLDASGQAAPLGDGLGGPVADGGLGAGAAPDSAGDDVAAQPGQGGAGTTSGAAAGGGSADAPGGAQAPAAGGPAAPGQPVAAGPTAVGITKDTVFLGGIYFNDAAAANAGLGAAGAKPGDSRDYYDVAIEDANSRGGVLGRKLQGVYHELRASSGEPIDQQYQAACDRWFKDNKVFAVATGDDVVLECSAKAGAVAVNGGPSLATAPVFASNPHLVAPTAIRLERLAAVTVDGLVRLRWHVPGAPWPTGKIGVITWDAPEYRYSYEQGTKRALAAKGLQVEQARFIAVPQTVNGLSDSSAAVNNAVLAFQAEGIDHVLIPDGPAGVFGGTGLTLLFLNAAESQQYRPRYGFNAQNSPGNSILPSRQQVGMLAVDHNDYAPAFDEGIAPNKQRERCFALMNAKGLDTSSPNTQIQASLACDFVGFVVQTLKLAGAPTRNAFLGAADRIGTTFAPSLTYGARLGPGRRDGVEMFRTSRYDEGCSCMRYTSKPFVL